VLVADRSVRGVRLALHLERREAALLIVALMAVFAVLAFKSGESQQHVG